MGPSSQSSRPATSVVSPIRSPSLAPPEASPSISLDDVVYTLFRHKVKIILLTIMGLAASISWYIYNPPPFVSNAKLFVRFVVVEGMSMRPSADDPVTKSPDMRGETIISSEQEIITSLDLARQVAQVIGPEKILGKTNVGNDVNLAASIVRAGLTAEAPKFSSVITVSFQHRDVELVQPVLREVIAQYLKKHLEIHRSAGMIGDFLSQETDQLRNSLGQTEEELRKAKTKAGVVSVEEAKQSYSAQISSIRQQVFAAQAELAERGSAIQEATKASGKESPEGAPSAPVKLAPSDSELAKSESELPDGVLEEYRIAVAKLDFLRRREQELLLLFTAETPRVREVRVQVAESLVAKQKLESAYPRLLVLAAGPVPIAPGQPSRGPAVDPTLEAFRISSLQAKIKVLNSQMDILRAEAAALGLAEGNIHELMRKKDLQEINYRRYAASLEQSRINEALGSGRVSNISQIQTPSPPGILFKKAIQIPAGLAVGGMVIGLGWAFFFELFLDRSVRKPGDFARKLKLELFLSIPDLTGKRPRRLPFWRRKRRLPESPAPAEFGGALLTENKVNPDAIQLVLPVGEQLLHPFHETLRDRLIAYFERCNLTHKPKLIALAGLGHGAGVTTTAAGLARCLSETGDGNVLLVDLSPGQSAARQFYQGKTVCGLDELLVTRGNAQIEGNLYVVSDSNKGERLSKVLPSRFRQLVPKLKASDFDYIIFDMPPVSELSVTPRLAGFMDMVLLVVESGKTSQELVQRAMVLLADSKVHAGAVLNKAKSYGPAKLAHDPGGLN